MKIQYSILLNVLLNGSQQVSSRYYKLPKELGISKIRYNRFIFFSSLDRVKWMMIWSLILDSNANNDHDKQWWHFRNWKKIINTGKNLKHVPWTSLLERQVQCLTQDKLSQAVKLAQSIRRSLWVREVACSSPVSSNALVKIECAWNSLGQGTH